MRPPRFWTLLLTICTPDHAREAVLGDFHEEYEHRLAALQSEIAANAWYRRQVVRSIPCLFADASSPWGPLGLWRDTVAVLLATMIGLLCVTLTGFVVTPFESLLRHHGVLGYSYRFWVDVVLIAVAAFVSGFVIVPMSYRQDLRIGIALGAAWIVFFVGPSVMAWAPSLPSGDQIVIPGALLSAMVGAISRIAWVTRGLRAS